MARLIDNSPPPPPSERKDMQVLVLSAPRSGSTSMGEALKVLGFHPFAGMAHNYFHENRFAVWDEAIEASYYGKGAKFTRRDFDKFLGSYDAVSGWGAAILAEDLVRVYPDAKVILTTREPDRWVESWNDTVVAIQRWWWKWKWILPICRGLERDFRRNADVSFYAWSYGDPFDRNQQRRLYINHNERVKEIVQRGRLLVMQASGSWEPLCRFLEKPVPERPYPHGARRDGFHVAMTMIWKRALFRALRRLGLGMSVGAVVLLAFRFRPGKTLKLY